MEKEIKASVAVINGQYVVYINPNTKIPDWIKGVMQLNPDITHNEHPLLFPVKYEDLKYKRHYIEAHGMIHFVEIGDDVTDILFLED